MKISLYLLSISTSLVPQTFPFLLFYEPLLAIDKAELITQEKTMYNGLTLEFAVNRLEVWRIMPKGEAHYIRGLLLRAINDESEEFIEAIEIIVKAITKNKGGKVLKR